MEFLKTYFLFLGSAICCWYSAIFPKEVDRLICIDLINMIPVPLELQVEQTGKGIREGVKTIEKLTPIYGSPRSVPTYTYIDAVAR